MVEEIIFELECKLNREEQGRAVIIEVFFVYEYRYNQVSKSKYSSSQNFCCLANVKASICNPGGT